MYKKFYKVFVHYKVLLIQIPALDKKLLPPHVMEKIKDDIKPSDNKDKAMENLRKGK